MNVSDRVLVTTDQLNTLARNADEFGLERRMDAADLAKAGGPRHALRLLSLLQRDVGGGREYIVRCTATLAPPTKGDRLTTVSHFDVRLRDWVMLEPNPLAEDEVAHIDPIETSVPLKYLIPDDRSPQAAGQ